MNRTTTITEVLAEGISLITTTRHQCEGTVSYATLSHSTIEREGSHFSILMDDSEPVGFEHHEYGDEWGGGLWFEGKKLTDYDGVSELPHGVITTLKAIGYDCSYAE